jgi:1-acyl-sn-glycerol-3-phosphate acyltransferase
MMLFISKLYWKLFGWKIVGALPKDIKKMLLVVAPHTSWKDLLLGFAVRHELKIHHAKFLGKKELFEGFFGGFLRNLGGIPVDRAAKLGIVEQVVRYFDENEEFIVGLSPEGTRNRVDKLKTGFYHIAKNAKIPMVMVGFDYKNTQVIVGEPIYTTESEEADLKKIIAFFATIEGANPAKDLRHFGEKS